MTKGHLVSVGKTKPIQTQSKPICFCPALTLANAVGRQFYFSPVPVFVKIHRNSFSYGEVSEWLKEQPWKGCVGLVSTAGSNPALSGCFWRGFVSAQKCVAWGSAFCNCPPDWLWTLQATTVVLRASVVISLQELRTALPLPFRRQCTS